jgi:DNA polymerase-3 subunit delta'
MLSAERVPNAMLFTGPRGVGKYTLAVLYAQAANCERLRDDACGECETCRQIARLFDPRPLLEAGLAERGESTDAATVERVPLILQAHPDVWAIVPDPVRLRTPVARPVIRTGQLRAVQRAAYFKPRMRRRVFLLDGAETMRADLASIFLKVLEEPPDSATLILLAPNPDLLLSTIRSRCLQFFFAPLGNEQVEEVLKQRTRLTAAQRRAAAEAAEGSPGAAIAIDLEESQRLRREVLGILAQAAKGRSFSALFTATNQLAKDEKESFENILELFYSLLTDLLELTAGPKASALRNSALRRDLEALSQSIDLDWVARAVEGLDQLHGRLRRNVNRQLGLDAVAVSLVRP